MKYILFQVTVLFVSPIIIILVRNAVATIQVNMTYIILYKRQCLLRLLYLCKLNHRMKYILAPVDLQG